MQAREGQRGEGRWRKENRRDKKLIFFAGKHQLLLDFLQEVWPSLN